MMAASSTISASISSASSSMSPSSSSTLQEGDGVRKSGPILLLGIGKRGGKSQSAYAVLSERALELHESEKAHRKRKGTRSIVDLSKCFNVSQQNCPKSKAGCVCLLMPDECFLFRGENANETVEWYGTLLSAVISARALNLGRPVFANEFFESVWDVTVCPQQPRLKRIPAPPNTAEFANSPNICVKLPELSGRKRLCFYPHTIILCNVGIEPALTGLPKSGIPPFRTMDFVEFSRHFIAQFGPVDKYFLMRIGRSSPMGSCEVWVQCESEDAAAEINRKLQEIIQRETEKKQQALMAIRGQQQGTAIRQVPPTGTPAGCPIPAAASSSSSYYCPAPYSGTPPTATASIAAAGAERSPVERTDSLPPFTTTGPIELEPISEDEALTAAAAAPSTPQAPGGRKKHSSLSQSAKEKRLELRECKAKVDSLEEEEQRFQQRQMMQMAQQQTAAASSGWNAAAAKRYTAFRSMDRPSGSPCSAGDSATTTISRPTCLLGQPTYQFRRRGSQGTIGAEIGARSKSLSLEEQQAQSFRPFVAGRLWTMDKADSLLLLGYGPPETEETEDSGGTLRMIPLDQDGSQAPSRSSSSLNLAGAHHQAGFASHSSSAGQLVETYVECHVRPGAGTNDEEDEEEEGEDGGRDEEEEESDSTEDENDGAPRGRRRQRKNAAAAKKEAAQRRRQKHRQLGGIQSGGGSLDAGAEADQSCSCSSSVASSSGHDEQHGPEGGIKLSNNQLPSTDYALMMVDKVSGSSDSISHLAVPLHPSMGFWCPEEICSYTSDSGDSCYSSMVNGQLNPRAFSFSSTSSAHHYGGASAGGKLGGGTGTAQQQHPAAAKWTAAMGQHRNYLFHQAPAHYSPPKGQHGHPQSGTGPQQVDSSSSSRFSMETSLITPLEEDERQVTFADEEQRDRLGHAPPSARDGGGDGDADDSDLLRKRAFSLGSKSWITKPFRKLSSAHGTPSSGRPQRSSCGGASRSGSSSLIGSMHADLCSVQEQSSQPHLASSSSNRLGSSSSFASSSAAGPIGGCSSSLLGDAHHTRSDSIGSSHSAAALSLQGLPRRNKPPRSEDANNNNEGDLVELEFMPGGKLSSTPASSSSFAVAHNRSTHCVASSASAADMRSPLRGRTNSCDDHNTSVTSGRHHGEHMVATMMGSGGATGSAGRSPYGEGGGRGSAGALNHSGHHQQQQQQGWPKQPRLRPSESFIRSIQQQQRELQRTRQQKQRQRLKTDFPLQEVQCFIAPAEREKIDAMTARDSLSLRSQRSGSGSCSQQFETIEECQKWAGSGEQKQQQPSRPQSRRSLTMKPSQQSAPIECAVDEEEKTSGGGGADESDYVLGEVKPATTTAVVKA